ncbi:MAG: phosphatidylserine decarboxylase, partial [Bacteroidota bacterium]
MILLIGGLYALLYWLIPIMLVQIILAVAALIFLVLVVRFFRDPEVITPAKDGMVYAPCDGKVVVIEKAYEGEWLKEDRIQLSIFMSPLNVHVNRSPIKGKVNFFKYHPGKYLVAWHPKSSTHNERTSIGFKSESGIDLLMR